MTSGIKVPDLAEEKFGALVLKRRIVKKISGASRVAYECECECGKVVIRRLDYLMSPRCKNASCGCKHSHYVRTGSKSDKWTGVGDLSGFYFCSIKKSAEGRSIPFGLTIEYIWSLYEQQHGLCALSGLPIRFRIGSMARQTQAQTASLDRKDASLGYVEGNVWWVHKVVNLMKNLYDVETFTLVCNAVADRFPREVNPEKIDLAEFPRTGKKKKKKPVGP